MLVFLHIFILYVVVFLHPSNNHLIESKKSKKKTNKKKTGRFIDHKKSQKFSLCPLQPLVFVYLRWPNWKTAITQCQSKLSERRRLQTKVTKRFSFGGAKAYFATRHTAATKTVSWFILRVWAQLGHGGSATGGGFGKQRGGSSCWNRVQSQPTAVRGPYSISGVANKKHRHEAYFSWHNLGRRRHATRHDVASAWGCFWRRSSCARLGPVPTPAPLGQHNDQEYWQPVTTILHSVENYRHMSIVVSFLFHCLLSFAVHCATPKKYMSVDIRKKEARFALCLQPPAKTGAVLDLQSIGKDKKINANKMYFSRLFLWQSCSFC